MKLHLPLLVVLLLQPRAANAWAFPELFDLFDAIFCPIPLLNSLLCNECNFYEPCNNEGVCTDGIGAFTCECPAPWGGDTCEVDLVDDCASTPCKNGGTCTDEVEGFTCECPAPWGGDTCEDDLVDDCASSPCKNGGTCTDEVDGFSCECADGWKGDTCEVVSCGADPCKNGGACTDEADGFTCVCADGWTGDTCEVVSIDITWMTTVEGGGEWVVTNDGTTIRFNIDNSVDCGGSNSNVQSGTARARIFPADSYDLTLEIVGISELDDNFELMTVSLNRQPLVSATSDALGLECGMGPVIFTEILPPPYTLSADSRYTFKIDFTTGDNLDHVDAYYELNLVFVPTEI